MALLYLDLGSMAAGYPDYSGSMALSMWNLGIMASEFLWGRQHGFIMFRLKQHGLFFCTLITVCLKQYLKPLIGNSVFEAMPTTWEGI